MVISRSALRLDQMLHRLCERYTGWHDTVRREKSIRNVMNMFNFDRGRKCLIGEAWCPHNRLDEVMVVIFVMVLFVVVLFVVVLFVVLFVMVLFVMVLFVMLFVVLFVMVLFVVLFVVLLFVMLFVMVLLLLLLLL